jgi:DNA-binding HxlR family transcriptional regulator
MREELPGRPCSVAAALNLVGEKWSLLAVREITFGNKRFDVIARNTGAPRDRLAARLRALEAAGVVARRQYSERPPRYEYELTEAGGELRLVLAALRLWGDKWAVEEPPVTFSHVSEGGACEGSVLEGGACEHDLDPVFTCRHCGTEVNPDSLKVRSLAPGWSLQGPAKASA